jgi:hypothetical protein
MYPWICAAKGIKLATMNCDVHFVQLYAELKKARPLTNIDSRMKLGRWNSFHDKHEAWKPDRLVVLMILISLGIEKRWWKSFHDCPLFRVIVSELDIDLDADGDEEMPGLVGPDDGGDDDKPEAPRGSSDPAPLPKRPKT